MAKKSVLIIGASRGLGLGLVREYLDRGWAVTATVRDVGRAPELAALAAEAGGDLRIETLDIDDGTQVASLAERLKDRVFDLLFLNAGISGPAVHDVAELTPEQVGAVFYTNAVAPVRLAQALAGNVRDDIGVIAFMSSRVGSVSDESSGRMPLYRASKAALNSMTRSLVKTLGDRPVTVLSLHPGWVRTDMGGPDAPVDVATSVAGLADTIEAHAGRKQHLFLDYQGSSIGW